MPEDRMKTTDDLVKIVSFGGGIIIDAKRTTDDLVKIVSFAANKGARVMIRGADRLTTDDLVQIASFGKGVVQFDLTE
jgi:hypothetical protein